MFYPDPKPDKRDKKPRKPLKRSGAIKRYSPAKREEIIQLSVQDKAFYEGISQKRSHICVYCDNPLPRVLSNYNCDHIFDKAIFPHLRHVEEDVVLTCLDCHTVKTSHKLTERMKRIMFNVSAILVSKGLLTEIGEPDYYSVKNWLIKPLK